MGKGKTISTHNGSKANRMHNIRAKKVVEKQEHIDTDKSVHNEILIDIEPREAYRRIFGKALKEYNNKQIRDDRKIYDYYNHIQKDEKKHVLYEMIIQVGDRNDTGIDPDETKEERAIIKEFIEGWESRNPSLKLIGAYIHADENEGTLHAHLDYIPVAHNYKRGLKTQNGLVKALGQQGFYKEGRATAQIKWEKRENKTLEDICLRHGIDVIHPAQEKREHLETEIYKKEQMSKDASKTIDRAYKTLEKVDIELEKTNDTLKQEKEKLNEVRSDVKQLFQAKESVSEFENNSEIKEKKTLLGKVFVTMPKNIYEQYRIYHAQVENAKALAVNAMRKSSRKYAEKLEKKLKELIEKNAELESENKSLKNENFYDKMAIKNLNYRLDAANDKIEKAVEAHPELRAELKPRKNRGMSR